MTGTPLPANAMQVHRICRCTDDAEKAVVDGVLARFFTLEADGWHNKRADREIAKYSDISTKRRNAARKKWDANADADADANAMHKSQSHIKPKVVEGGGSNGSGKKAPSSQFSQKDFDERDWRKLSEAKRKIVERQMARVGCGEMTEAEFWEAVAEDSGLTIQRILNLQKTCGQVKQ